MFKGIVNFFRTNRVWSFVRFMLESISGFILHFITLLMACTAMKVGYYALAVVCLIPAITTVGYSVVDYFRYSKTMKEINNFMRSFGEDLVNADFSLVK